MYRKLLIVLIKFAPSVLYYLDKNTASMYQQIKIKSPQRYSPTNERICGSKEKNEVVGFFVFFSFFSSCGAYFSSTAGHSLALT